MKSDDDLPGIPHGHGRRLQITLTNDEAAAVRAFRHSANHASDTAACAALVRAGLEALALDYIAMRNHLDVWVAVRLPPGHSGGVSEAEANEIARVQNEKAAPAAWLEPLDANGTMGLASGHAYVPWANAGGPNECAHGYVAGLRCPRCEAVSGGGKS